MCNEDSRGNESSDRQNESSRNQPTSDDLTLEEALETIDHLTRMLLVDSHEPSTRFQHCSRAHRRDIRRRLREIRAEATRIGLVAIGPEAAMPYRPEGDSSPGPDGVTTYSGPDPSVDDPTRRAIDSNADFESNSPTDEESTSESSDADTDPDDTTDERGERDD